MALETVQCYQALFVLNLSFLCFTNFIQFLQNYQSLNLNSFKHVKFSSILDQIQLLQVLPI